MQRVINRLDIPRDQVYAEVIIMEMNLGRDFQYSSNFVNPKNGIGISTSGDLLNFLQNPVSQQGAVLGFREEKTIDITVGGQTTKVPSLAALITLLQTKSNANILATPQILALDNTEATFETSENVPVPTSTAVQGAGVATSFTKERVSLSIKIKPQINKLANFVKLEIDTKLGNINRQIVPEQLQGQAVGTLERTAKTSLVVADKDTIVLGGLVRDNVGEQIAKVPILGDIPLLGWLFKSKQTQSNKTNLLVFITPHIIRQYESVRAILDKKLKERDEFLESTTGGEDPLRKYRDNMIRGLPDVSELQKSVPQRTFTIDPESPPITTPGRAKVAPQSNADSSASQLPMGSAMPPAPEAPPIPEFSLELADPANEGFPPPEGDPLPPPPTFDDGFEG